MRMNLNGDSLNFFVTPARAQSSSLYRTKRRLNVNELKRRFHKLFCYTHALPLFISVTTTQERKSSTKGHSKFHQNFLLHPPHAPLHFSNHITEKEVEEHEIAVITQALKTCRLKRGGRQPLRRTRTAIQINGEKINETSV